MINTYEQLKNDALQLLEEYEANPTIKKALNFNLPNSSEATDYDGWIEGAKKFALDNYDLLKEWVK